MGIIKNHKEIIKSEKGIVSIVVTMTIMIVLTLIVIGFAQLSRREQEQAVERQLNTQAFYSAESGVNDAKEKFDAGEVDVSRDYMPDCNEFGASFATQLDPVISPTSSYSCLLVDPSPTSLVYGPVEKGNSSI